FPVINAQAPFEALPEGQTSGVANVVVTITGVSSAPFAVPLVAAAPGVFTIPAGQGNAVLLFVDPADGVAKIAAPTSESASFGFPTAPIPRGSAGYFYATGLGAMQPPLLDGVADSIAHFAIPEPVV